jgi:hypothetical protein
MSLTYARQKLIEPDELEPRLEDDSLVLGEIVQALRQEFESGDALLKLRMQLLEQKVAELTERCQWSSRGCRGTWFVVIVARASTL